MNTNQTSVTDRIKTVKDAIDALGIDDKDVKAYEVCLDAFGIDSHLTCYAALVVVTKALNEGWTPDWNSGKWDKYYTWFYMGGSSGFRFVVCDYLGSSSHVGSRLCLKSSELAEYSGEQFIELHKKFMLIDGNN